MRDLFFPEEGIPPFGLAATKTFSTTSKPWGMLETLQKNLPDRTYSYSKHFLIVDPSQYVPISVRLYRCILSDSFGSD